MFIEIIESYILICVMSIIKGISMKFADLLNEHKLQEVPSNISEEGFIKRFLSVDNKKYFGISSIMWPGIAWGIYALLLGEINKYLFIAYFSLMISFGLRKKIDFANHIVGYLIVISGYCIIVVNDLQFHWFILPWNGLFQASEALNLHAIYMFIALIFLFTIAGFLHDYIIKYHVHSGCFTRSGAERLHSFIGYYLIPILFYIILVLFSDNTNIRVLKVFPVSFIVLILAYEIMREVSVKGLGLTYSEDGKNE